MMGTEDLINASQLPDDTPQLPDDPCLFREIIRRLLESHKQSQRMIEQLEDRLQQLLRDDLEQIQ